MSKIKLLKQSLSASILFGGGGEMLSLSGYILEMNVGMKQKPNVHFQELCIFFWQTLHTFHTVKCFTADLVLLQENTVHATMCGNFESSERFLKLKKLCLTYELCVLDFIEKNVHEGTKQYFKHVGKCGRCPVRGLSKSCSLLGVNWVSFNISSAYVSEKNVNNKVGKWWNKKKLE